MKLFLPSSQVLLPLERRADLVREFLAAGGSENEVYGFEAAGEAPLLLRDHVGQVCDMPRVLAGCVFNEPDLLGILGVCHKNADRAVLLRGSTRFHFGLDISVDVIFAGDRCIKNRSGDVGSLADFMATPTCEKAEVVG